MTNRIMRAIAATVLLVVPLSACNDVLDVTIQGQITDDLTRSPAGAEGLRLGAYQTWAFRNGAVTGTILTDISNYGQVLWSGMLTDEFVNRNTTGNAVVAIDRRDGVGSADYNQMHQIRSRAREAIQALTTFVPLVQRPRGQMWFLIGYTELQFAEMYCAGVPLSRVVDGAIEYGSPLTMTQMYDSAIVHFDSALAYLGDAADTAAVNLNNASRIAKARALIGRGGQGDDAAAVTAVAAIPTAYAYALTFGGGTVSNNGLAQLNSLNNRVGVGDSVNPDGSVAPNALPFASAGDPRVPVTGSSRLGQPTTTAGNNGAPWVRQNIWTALTTPFNIVSGLDARLIEAEAQLKARNIAGMMNILNSLRATPPSLSTTYRPAAMAALPVPATQEAAVRLFFREKAFWTFGRGQRQGDLRRLARQWGPGSTANFAAFSPANVFPIGNYFSNNGLVDGTYAQTTGNPGEVNFTLNENRSTNPNMPEVNTALTPLGALGTCQNRNP
jgi:hypothetical protein